MSCRRRHILYVGVTTQDVCSLTRLVASTCKAHQLDVFGYFISELCYSSHSRIVPTTYTHAGRACFCQIASVDPGRAQHQFECLDLCLSGATL